MSVKYCPNCRREMNAERLRQRREKMAVKRAESMAETQAARDRAYCAQCFWHAKIGGNLCDYMLQTGEKRGCKAGEGCIRRAVHELEK